MTLHRKFYRMRLLREYRTNEKTKNEPVAAPMLINQDDTPDKMSEVFHRIRKCLKDEPRKVLIVEENPVHVKALCYFTGEFQYLS